MVNFSKTNLDVFIEQAKQIIRDLPNVSVVTVKILIKKDVAEITAADLGKC